MAKFLIQAGADVNALEADMGGYLCPPLGCVDGLDCEITMRERVLRTECIKVLLASDADASVLRDAGNSVRESMLKEELSICSLASLKAFLDLGSPFITLNCTGADIIELPPLLILASSHSSGHLADFETPDKIALLLVRGADVSARDSLENNCLHIVMSSEINAWNKPKLNRQTELKDMLMLMITAGADVYAINDDDETVSDIAHLYGHCQIWAQVLEACGYYIFEVRRGTNTGLGLSSAVDPLHTRRSCERTSKLSFADYLKQRKAFSPIQEIFDYKDAEDEHVQEKLRMLADWDSYDGETSEEEQEHESAWDWDAGDVTGGDDDDDESNLEENDDEEMWNWNRDDDMDDNDKRVVKTSDYEVKWD